MKKLITLSVILLTFCQPVQAHPHSWLQLTTDFVIDNNGDIKQLKQRWIFDPYYSTLTIDDLKKTHGNLDIGLAIHADGIINNLESFNYYSHLSINNENIPINRPSKYHLSSASFEQEALLILEMHFDLPKTAMQSAELKWQVYDPTYYVSMRHDTAKQVRLYNESTLECEPEIIEAEPDEQLRLYAESLDKTQTETTGLGKLFAQTVAVRCF
ncbi:DUF1007 family protein [Reinekea marina]|uniref:DUF1007 family protein n=1 Tax=Reinekea marina TaxID=1310421 RepID=A0ABV7WMJ9_9GAMM|nr:DUF1007 family protein [Reinekea marina]MDN3648407.1 DUF1007 family protein [Reinekea marina]